MEGSRRKNDDIDSRATALTALRRRGLSEVAREDFAQVMRLLIDRREQLTAQRTRTINRLHRLLADLIAGAAPRKLSAKTAARLLDGVTPATGVELERKLIARDLLADVVRLDEQLADNRRRISAAVKASQTTVTSVFGVGDITAAMLIAHSGDATRFAGPARYASYNGSAPVEAPSGDTRRHRVNLGGNRQLNRALHTAAVIQIRRPTDGQAYYRRKLAEGKTEKEALRALKRRLSDVVYRHLLHDCQTGKIPHLPNAA